MGFAVSRAMWRLVRLNARLVLLLIVILALMAGCERSSEPETSTAPVKIENTANSASVPEPPLTVEANPEAKPGPASWSDPTDAVEMPPGQFRFELPEGFVEGKIASSRDHDAPPITAWQLPETSEGVYLQLSWEHPEPIHLYVDFIAEDVFGHAPNTRLDGALETLRPGKHEAHEKLWSLSRKRIPGRYRIDLQIEDGPGGSFVLDVLPVAPPAELIKPHQRPAGFNVALAVLGGKIVIQSSQSTANTWAAGNLIDGFGQVYGEGAGDLAKGWQNDPKLPYPADVIFSFNHDRRPFIHAVIVDNAGVDIDLYVPGKPKHIEIWVADEIATDTEAGATGNDQGWTRVAEARLWSSTEPQLIRFEPVAAKFVKLRVLSAHNDDKYMAMGEFAIIELPDQANSILADLPRNLALPALGGNIESYTSDDGSNPVWRLVDDRTGGDDTSWMAAKPETRQPAPLPQDFVFSFNHGLPGLVDRVEIDADSQPRYSSGDFSNRWPKLVAVAISDGYDEPFREVTRATLKQERGTQAIPVGQLARLVRVRVLENYGGENTTVSEIRIIEGTQSGYNSILAVGPVSSIEQTPPPSLPQPDSQEQNDSPGQATRFQLGQEISASLHQYDDIDWYQFQVPGTQPQILNIQLTGDPALRTRLALDEQLGAPAQLFIPEGNAGAEIQFNWQVDSGEHLLNMRGLPLRVVLVWDRSGSMQGRTEALEIAVRRYLDNLAEDEQVQLVQFSSKAEVLLEEFTADLGLIKPAIEDRFEPQGSTSLSDALLEALSLLKAGGGRQVVILFTDGHDSTSKTPFGEFWQGVEKSSAQIYAIGLGVGMRNYSRRIAGTGVQFLQRITRLSNGRYFFAADTDELGPIFDTIAAEVRAAPRYTMLASLSEATGKLKVESIGERIPALAPPRFELILDGSGSMKKTVSDGRTRMQVAKQVLKEVIDGVPAEVEIALRTFGHRVREGTAGDCEDSELLVDFGQQQSAKLKQQIDKVTALGTTPIAWSLRQAVTDLANGQEDIGQGEGLIILVTDGEEECHADLQAAVKELKAGGIDFRVNIVGFEIGEETISATLRQVAEQSGGMFVESNDAEALSKALQQTLSPQFTVEDQGGNVIARGLIDQQAIELPIGSYRLRINSIADLIDASVVQIMTDQTTTVSLSKAGAAVAISSTTK